MTFKRLIAAIALACLLGLTTFGGEMSTPPCTPGEVGTPPCQSSATGDTQGVPGDVDTPGAPSNDTFTAIAEGVLKEMLAIW